MPDYTIEVAYHLPVYRQRSYSADTPAQACRLAIEDDGCGFDPGRVDAQAHWGLALMHERAAAVGGSVEVAARPGAGTCIRVRMGGET